MYRIERHRYILEQLECHLRLKAQDVQKSLGVTAMTLWRDFRELENQGLLKRTRGGVEHRSVATEAQYSSKKPNSWAVKEALAAYAARTFINDGDILILDGGTTISALAAEVVSMNLSILTNSIPIAQFFMDHQFKGSLYLGGGLLRPESGTLVGRETVSFFNKRRATSYFMSATGFDASSGTTDPNPQEIEVKQAMASSAQQVILLTDATKYGQISLMQTLPWRRIHKLVTNASAEQINELRKPNSIFPEVFSL